MDQSLLLRRSKSAAALLAAYVAMQIMLMIAHEFAHSTTAWLLGYTFTPFTVVWGNPITITGWDEGVPYNDLFHERGQVAEAAIGGMPLFMHAVLVASCLYLLLRADRETGRVRFFGIYVLTLFNLAELFAYIVLRPFIPTGDTGRFNEGLAISVWPLFLGGLAFLGTALWLFSRRIGPKIDLWTDGSRFEHRAVTAFAGFIIFLWGSGIRMLSLYPDPQWKVGLLGVAGFVLWILADPAPPAARLRLPCADG